MKSPRTVLLVLTACLLLGSGGPVRAQEFDWPCWRGPDGTGVSRETNWNPEALAGGPRVLWNVSVGMGYSNVAIIGDRVYTMGCKDWGALVQCLQADTGEPVWQYSLPGCVGDSQATPTVAGGFLYALTNDGILFSLNVRNGKLRWKKDLVNDYGAVKPAYQFAGSPVVDGKLVILTANTAGMAVESRNGRLVWSSEKPDKARPPVVGPYASTGTEYVTPVLYTQNGKRLAIVSSEKGLSGVETATGATVWLYPWKRYGGGQGGDPVVVANRVLVTFDITQPTGQAESVLLEPGAGQPAVVWRTPDFCSQFATPVIVDGYIYGCFGGPSHRQATLRCLEVETGQLMWEEPVVSTPRQKLISVTAAAGYLIVLNDQGTLVLAKADPAGYKEVSRCDVLAGEKKMRQFWTPPVLCNGRLYCRNFAGDLVCIDMRP